MSKKHPLKSAVLAEIRQTSEENAWQKQATEVTRLELRGDGGLHGSEKPGWSAGGMEK